MDNIEWLTNEHMLITMQMMHIGHLKNQQYDQHLDPSLCGEKKMNKNVYNTFISMATTRYCH